MTYKILRLIIIDVGHKTSSECVLKFYEKTKYSKNIIEDQANFKAPKL